jgi:hypothetical protein
MGTGYVIKQIAPVVEKHCAPEEKPWLAAVAVAL